MRERDIIKKALEAKLPNKENIRTACLEGKVKSFAVRRVLVAAACILILCSCVLILPMMKQSEDKYISTTDKTIVTESNNISAESEQYIESESSVETTPDIENDNPAIGGGESALCPIHSFEYHAIPGVLIDYVGEEAFKEWDSQFYDDEGWYIRDENGCYPGFNIVAFINYFNIPDEEIIKAYPGYYNSHSAYWNLDLLLTRDATAYENFARKMTLTKEEERIYEERLRDEYYKTRVLDLLKEKKDSRSINYYNKITHNGTMLLSEEYSILDLVENSSLTKEEVESVFGIDNREGIQRVDFVYKYTYNIDLLFEEKAALYAEIEKLEDIPYVPRAAQIDELLHIGYNGELAVKGEAIETEYGIYIPEGLLPLSDGDLPLEKDMILYKGRIYWYTATVTENEEHIIDHVKSTIPVGHTHGDIEKGKTNWDTYRYYHFASSSVGDVYLLDDYDSSFRIMFNNYFTDPNTMKIYEANKGLVLDKGSDLYGEKGLNLQKNSVSLSVGEKLADDSMKERLILELQEGDFVLDNSDVSVYRSISLKINLDDLSNVTLTLYENGYVEYSEISGYGVYLEIDNTELVQDFFE